MSMGESAKAPGSSEAHSQLVKDCCEELALLGFAAWPNRTGAAWIDGRFIAFGKKGSGDILAIFPFLLAGKRYGIHAEVECKTGDAVQNKRQKSHMRMVRNSGGIYLVIRSRQELRAELAGLGFTPPGSASAAGPYTRD
jgi:hypothetical protein